MHSKEIYKKIDIFSSSLALARKKNILIEPLPINITKNINIVKQIKNLAEAKLKWHPIGFKIGATNKKIMKILKAKEPFYSFIFKEQTFNSKKKLKLSPNTLGIELEVAYKINKKIFNIRVNKKKQLKKYIDGITPAIELVGYRQKLKKTNFVGQAIVDFGLNISFVKSKVYKIKNILEFQSKTKITNLNNKKIYLGHTKNILGNPINSLFWLIKELQNKGIFLNNDFWVTTGSTTSIVPVKKGEKFTGEILPIGKVQVNF
jgi:2-keto-4-pentenoate hydratase|tara:strand:- start:304 stop:1086 length:783 start_codon:yes stop_codon:yes gene_type:complete